MSSKTAELVSIQVGLPRTYSTESPNCHANGAWTTGFYKEPVVGPVFVGKRNISGDGQADLRVHGGVDKAVLAYAADHYVHWRSELAIDNLPFGAFGENLTLAKVDEKDICVGDIWQFADVRLEVSQPRQPCWKLARRWKRKQLPQLVVQSGRSGWYFRVLQEGLLESGVQGRLVERRHEKWTINEANQAMYGTGIDRATLLELMSLAELSKSWISALG